MKEKKKKGRSFDTASLNYSLEIITWPIKREIGRRVRPSRIYRSTINFKPCICNRSRIEIRTFLSLKKFRKFISLYLQSNRSSQKKIFRVKDIAKSVSNSEGSVGSVK